MEINYYEVEFGQNRELNNDNFAGYPDRHSVCILADHAPSLEEIEKFCKSMMDETGYDAVCSVKEIDYYEANEWFDVNADTILPFLSSKEFPAFTKSPEAILKENYERYKKSWIEDNVDNGLLTSTEALYENCDEIGSNTTFEQYVEQFGYADGSCYYSFDEYLVNTLADRIDCYLRENRITEIPESLSAIIDMSDSDKSYNALKEILKNGDTAPLFDYISDEFNAVLSQESVNKIATEDIINLYTELKAVKEHSVGVDMKNIFKEAEHNISSADLIPCHNNMYKIEWWGSVANEIVKRGCLHSEELQNLVDEYKYPDVPLEYLYDPDIIVEETDKFSRMRMSEYTEEIYLSYDKSNGYEAVSLHYCILDKDIDVEIPLSNDERAEFISIINDYEIYEPKPRPYHNMDDLSQPSFFAYNIEDRLYTAVFSLECKADISDFPYYDKNSRQNTFDTLKALYKSNDIQAMEDTIAFIDKVVDSLSSTPPQDYDPSIRLREFTCEGLKYLQGEFIKYIDTVKETPDKSEQKKPKIERD